MTENLNTFSNENKKKVEKKTYNCTKWILIALSYVKFSNNIIKELENLEDLIEFSNSNENHDIILKENKKNVKIKLESSEKVFLINFFV